MKKSYIISAALIVIAIVAFSEVSLAQCAMCKTTVESNVAQNRGFGRGLNSGILYLMSFPYIVLSLIAYFWYKTSRKDTEKKNKIANLLRRKLYS